MADTKEPVKDTSISKTATTEIKSLGLPKISSVEEFVEPPLEVIEDSDPPRMVYYNFDRDTILEATILAEFDGDYLDLECTHLFSGARVTKLDKISTRQFLKVSKGSRGKIGTWFEGE
jgi:hypothetical protein